MRWLFISRRRHEAELDAVNADRERLRAERDQFAKDRNAHRAAARKAAELFAEADGAAKRLSGRNRELKQRLNQAHDNQLVDTVDVLRVEARVRRLLKVGERLANALRTSERRADLLQNRLDDAVGLTSPALNWRSTRTEQAKAEAL